jgi:hypothetical protein
MDGAGELDEGVVFPVVAPGRSQRGAAHVSLEQSCLPSAKANGLNVLLDASDANAVHALASRTVDRLMP